MAAVGEPAAGSVPGLLCVRCDCGCIALLWSMRLSALCVAAHALGMCCCAWHYCVVIVCLIHMGGMGIFCDEGRGRAREAGGMPGVRIVLCEHGNPFDLSISLKGGEETNKDSVSSGE